MQAYVQAFRALWSAAAVVAFLMVGVQAATGWEKGEGLAEVASESGDSEVWEEGLEEGA